MVQKNYVFDTYDRPSASLLRSVCMYFEEHVLLNNNESTEIFNSSFIEPVYRVTWKSAMVSQIIYKNNTNKILSQFGRKNTSFKIENEIEDLSQSSSKIILIMDLSNAKMCFLSSF